MIKAALVGNPNTGKTSLFNTLTGSYEYVGNWSGVTVEKKVGALKNNGGQLIDLPGIYSLTPYSKDEAVVIQYFLNETFDKVLNIVDASQLERNLQLTVSLLEYEKPMMIGLNMIDVAKRRGLTIDVDRLSKALGTTVIPIVARTGKGCDQILQSLANEPSKPTKTVIFYGNEIEKSIDSITRLLSGQMLPFPKRWLAIQILMGNEYAVRYAEERVSSQKIKEIKLQLEKQLHSKYGMSTERWMMEKRKNWIRQIVKESTIQKEEHSVNWSERLDEILTNRFLGVPIFFLCMYIMFSLTFDWIGTPLSDVLDAFFSGPLTDWTSSLLNTVNAAPFIRALILNGIIAGVGGVLVFVPQIFVLFLFISFLEDSGYMARAALVMDRLMERVGLNGKAFIPMIIGFGCNVPGVMAARTIEQPKERLLTILLTPLMSCSARLPVYALFAGTFFTANQGMVVFSLYVLGIVVALALAKIFSLTIVRNEVSLFVIELPPYRIPHGRTLWRSTWDKGKGFIRKAGTFIFGGSVVIWLLSYMGPGGWNVEMDHSFLAMIGGFIAPILAPLGFGTWQAGASIITGFMAKEVVVSTMNIIYHTSNTDALQGVIADQFTPISAYSFLVFILLYVPCVATVAAIRFETGSKKWTLFSIGYGLLIAYLLSFIIFQVGKLFF
ncbi:ferrous iron transport protein B [Oikeobacillus pervagus]|uniref:Ferrous iron transport protein B n=1 Tax=Oikeobacillus pervagus TaxID=1325931 RepID=A0AAJ1SWZ5_9BACI|nr:ferrous iron transport protein B [Oikeobacillus pervagus]MDQ0214328.1 ferrous iron transport protein B [Oikeobacillus pervagus]